MLILFCAGVGFLLPVFLGAKFDLNISTLIAFIFGVLALIASALCRSAFLAQSSSRVFVTT